jgi:predicted nucleic acid-binding protein
VAEPIVVNTGPLVSFARIGCLKAEGLISELKPLIAKAIDAGIWYNRELVRSFLAAAGE